MLEEILLNNKRVKEEIHKLQEQIHKLKKEVKPPCEACPYDGVYRCESCAENFYEGFNIREYPNPQVEYVRGRSCNEFGCECDEGLIPTDADDYEDY